MLSRCALQTQFVSNVERRTWDLSQFEELAKQKASERENRGKPDRSTALVERAPLKQRDTAVDLYSRVGKYAVITNATPLAQRGGYYCDICECLLKDSMSYLDHLNGKKRKSTEHTQCCIKGTALPFFVPDCTMDLAAVELRSVADALCYVLRCVCLLPAATDQKALGMSMKVERSSLSQVKARLEEHKRSAEEEKTSESIEDVAARLERYEEEQKNKKKRKKDKKNNNGEEDSSSADGTKKQKTDGEEGKEKEMR